MKKLFKSFAEMFLATALVFSIVGCSNDSGSSNEGNDSDAKLVITLNCPNFGNTETALNFFDDGTYVVTAGTDEKIYEKGVYEFNDQIYKDGKNLSLTAKHVLYNGEWEDIEYTSLSRYHLKFDAESAEYTLLFSSSSLDLEVYPATYYADLISDATYKVYYDGKLLKSFDSDTLKEYIKILNETDYLITDNFFTITLTDSGYKKVTTSGDDDNNDDDNENGTSITPSNSDDNNDDDDSENSSSTATMRPLRYVGWLVCMIDSDEWDKYKQNLTLGQDYSFDNVFHTDSIILNASGYIKLYDYIAAKKSKGYSVYIGTTSALSGTYEGSIHKYSNSEQKFYITLATDSETYTIKEWNDESKNGDPEATRTGSLIPTSQGGEILGNGDDGYIFHFLPPYNLSSNNEWTIYIEEKTSDSYEWQGTVTKQE